MHVRVSLGKIVKTELLLAGSMYIIGHQCVCVSVCVCVCVCVGGCMNLAYVVKCFKSSI